MHCNGSPNRLLARPTHPCRAVASLAAFTERQVADSLIQGRKPRNAGACCSLLPFVLLPLAWTGSFSAASRATRVRGPFFCCFFAAQCVLLVPA